MLIVTPLVPVTLANGDIVQTAGNYHGSVTEAHGPILVGYDECPCAACADVEPWERLAMLKVVVDGVVCGLAHVRHESFTGAVL